MNQKESELESILHQHIINSSGNSHHGSMHHTAIIVVVILFGVFLIINMPDNPSFAIQGFAIKETFSAANTMAPAKQQVVEKAVAVETAKPNVKKVQPQLSKDSWLYKLRTHPQLPYIQIVLYTMWIMIVGVACAGFIEYKRKRGKHP